MASAMLEMRSRDESNAYCTNIRQREWMFARADPSSLTHPPLPGRAAEGRPEGGKGGRGCSGEAASDEILEGSST